MTAAAQQLPAQVVHRLRERRESVAVAESLTGGAVCAALVSVPGASTVLRGGVTAYATDLKARLLGVAEPLLAAYGPVHPEVALQMARGVRERLGAVWGAATTGVAGPGASDGHPAGTVVVAVAGPVEEVLQLQLSGDRSSVRGQSVEQVLALLLRHLGASTEHR